MLKVYAAPHLTGTIKFSERFLRLYTKGHDPDGIMEDDKGVAAALSVTLRQFVDRRRER